MNQSTMKGANRAIPSKSGVSPQSCDLYTDLEVISVAYFWVKLFRIMVHKVINVDPTPHNQHTHNTLFQCKLS